MHNKLEGLTIELELSASDANVTILSRDSRQPMIEKSLAWGGVFKHVRCSASSNGTCIPKKISDAIWRFDIELNAYFGKYIKSDRWRVVIVFGQATEWHLAFVGEELGFVL